MSEQINHPNEEVTRLASRFHNDWRESRLLEDGSYDPRPKQTLDEEWIRAHGSSEVDIANTDYEDLPSDWQEENKAAAEVAQSLLNEGYANHEDIKGDEFVESASSQIHEAWLGRNGWAIGGELDVPYDQLPEAEKLKDRAQILTAIELSLSNSQ